MIGERRIGIIDVTLAEHVKTPQPSPSLHRPTRHNEGTLDPPYSLAGRRGLWGRRRRRSASTPKVGSSWRGT